MKISRSFALVVFPLLALSIGGSLLWRAAADTPADPEPSQGWTLTTWNDLGMHCMDEDFSVFAILPPFNTLNAELIDKNGDRVTGTNGITVYYEAATDPDGSETKTSVPQTNFWEFAEKLFGTNLPDDTGLIGNAMPGISNTPQPMLWNADHSWWTAEGIPLIPKNKFGDAQAYPLVRVTARNSAGTLLADTLVTAPVSSEMNCVTCHGSGKQVAAMPASGWENDADPVRDYRLNILKRHDAQHVGNPLYIAALASVGYSAQGLYDSVISDAKPVLCASCHGSNALGTSGFPGVPSLTQALHTKHAAAEDPVTGTTLGSSINRASCYQCHPGKQTKCLRGAMGRASDSFGQPAMSCQSCHGGMAEVGAPGRAGWFDEPNCQSCHTGTHTNNAGQLRFLSSFLADGSVREPADARFATTPDAPAPGVSLFRFSKGHGGLTCSACHGSPHAVYPTSERNDNIQSLKLQGHVGTISDCSSCHQNDVSHTRTATGGPHGMHGINEWWIKEHHDIAENDTSCNACHGTTSRGGELSKALGPRAFNTEKFGTVQYWQGQQVSCYDCHDGPNESRHFRQAKPVVQSFGIQTQTETTMTANLLGSDSDTAVLSYRIVDPPEHGTLAISGAQVAYTPNPGFAGTDYFNYCARDNKTDSNLGRVNIEVGADAANADLDGDGLSDLVERAFGLSVSRVSRGTAPEIAFCEINGERILQAIYDPKLIPPDLSVIFEASSDLSNWDENAPSISTTTDAAGRTVKRISVDAQSRIFLRYRVVRQ
jgi:hypothetical protein